MSVVTNWFHCFSRTTRPRPAKAAARPRLAVESLEDRAMPSIVFQPQFGPEQATDHGGLKLNDVPVYLIFKGAYWTGDPTPGNPSESDIITATSSILSGPYFQQLKQYGVDGNAHLAGTYTDGANIKANFSSSDLQDVVGNAQDHGIPESDDGPYEPLYVVVTPPGVASGDAGAASYNILQHHYSFPFDYDDVPLVWLGGITPNGLPADATMLDIYTNNFSHEVAESITCIDGSGIVAPPSPAFSAQFGNPAGISQIGDNEADQYTYRLSTGFLVQSLWSQADQAYVVDDGNSEKFLVSGGVLTINDDQAASANDSIYVSTSPRGGAQVNLDGDVVNFDPGQISKVVIRCHTGNDQITINNTGAVPIEVFLGSGNDTVTVGGVLQTRKFDTMSLTVHGGSGSGTLVINDQGNAAAASYNINSSVIFTSDSFAPIFYDHLSQVTINGGSGADSVAVNSTSTATTFHAGGGFNQVSIAPGLDNLDTIGSVLIDGGKGGASLVINDQANLAARYAFLISQATYTLTDNSLTRDAVSGPRFVLNPHRTATIQFANLMSLTLNTGTASNTDNLRSSAVPVTLNAGAADAIIAGNPGLGTINTLSVNGHGGSLTLDDRGTGNLNTPTHKVVNNVTFTVTGNTVMRVDHVHEQQVIFLGKVSILDINENETFSYANVSSLILEGGPVATTFNIQSTAPGTPVTVIAGANGNSFNVGAGGSVKGIQSVLTLKGGGAQSAIVLDDSSALVRDVVSVTPTQVGAGASDHFFGAGGLLNYASVGALTLDLSNAAADAVGLTPSAVTALFMNGNASQFLTGQGASLDLDLTGVLDALNGPGAPGAGIWTFGNRLAATYSGMASTGPA